MEVGVIGWRAAELHDEFEKTEEHQQLLREREEKSREDLRREAQIRDEEEMKANIELCREWVKAGHDLSEFPVETAKQGRACAFFQNSDEYKQLQYFNKFRNWMREGRPLMGMSLDEESMEALEEFEKTEEYQQLLREQEEKRRQEKLEREIPPLPTELLREPEVVPEEELPLPSEEWIESAGIPIQKRIEEPEEARRAQFARAREVFAKRRAEKVLPVEELQPAEMMEAQIPPAPDLTEAMRKRRAALEESMIQSQEEQREQERLAEERKQEQEQRPRAEMEERVRGELPYLEEVRRGIRPRPTAARFSQNIIRDVLRDAGITFKRVNEAQGKRKQQQDLIEQTIKAFSGSGVVRGYKVTSEQNREIRIFLQDLAEQGFNRLLDFYGLGRRLDLSGPQERRG